MPVLLFILSIVIVFISGGIFNNSKSDNPYCKMTHPPQLFRDSAGRFGVGTGTPQMTIHPSDVPPAVARIGVVRPNEEIIQEYTGIQSPGLIF